MCVEGQVTLGQSCGLLEKGRTGPEYQVTYLVFRELGLKTHVERT